MVADKPASIVADIKPVAGPVAAASTGPMSKDDVVASMIAKLKGQPVDA